mmetsp:Transcript_5375/g.14952  ORF Transcript_5375/g.14952 Transcript_5375/m.14952 type:complete len:83 (+) Transcript_5375:1-249(+)
MKSSTVSVAAISDAYQALQSSAVVDPRDGSTAPVLQGVDRGGGPRALVVVLLPQLGDFESSEYAEHLAAVEGISPAQALPFG